MDVLKVFFLVVLVSWCDAGAIRRYCGFYLTEALKKVCTWDGEDVPCFHHLSYNDHYDESAELESSRRIRRHANVRGTVSHCCKERCDIEALAPQMCCEEREARLFYREYHLHQLEEFYRIFMRPE